jgi:hypothetical protein
MISLRRLSGLLVIASLAAACDLNPQPLPPGEQPDGSVNEQPPSDTNGGTGTPSGSDGGTESLGVGDASVDAASDGSDGAIDGESDAPVDAGDAAD